MGLSVFMSITLCPPIIFLQFFKEVLKRRTSVCGCSSFSLMGNNFQTGYNRHEGFDKVESLGMRRGWGLGRGGRGGFRKALPPPFSKRSGAGTEEVVPTPFEERGDILRGMDVARTRPPSQGKEGEPGWRRKPGIRACITRRAAVKRPTRRLRRTESQG